VKILILKVQTIGDTLLTSRLISNLKAYHPDAMIDVMVNEGTQQMLSLNTEVNRMFEYKRESQRGLSNWQRLTSDIHFLKSIRHAKYDLLIDLDEGDRGALIARISGARIMVGSATTTSQFLRNSYTHLLPKRDNRHTVEINLDVLKLLSIPIVDKHVRIFWSQEDEALVSKQLKNIDQFIHIHPFSKGCFKDVDIQTTAQIIDYCEQKLGVRVVIMAAPNPRELERLQDILQLCESSPLNLRGNLTLKQIAVLNQKASLFVGVDTAIMHISAANDIPTLAFFGPTAPDTWGPWDNQLKSANYHRDGGLQCSGKHRVLSDNRSCLPCNKEGFDNSQVSDCLIGLNMNVIQSNIKDMLVS